MKFNVNTEIAVTHLLTRKKQTMVAALGVTVGIGIFIFMLSLVVGNNRKSDEGLFKSVPHIRIYQEDILSQPLLKEVDKSFVSILVNPKISNQSISLINPVKIVSDIQKQNDVVSVAPQVTVNLFYNNGISQLNGIASGVNIIEANAMFNIQSTLVAGNIRDLVTSPNGIMIGVGIADKLNIQLNDNINITSAIGIIKVMKVVGIFKTSSSTIDLTKSYINLAMAQQLLRQSSSYVTDIFVNIKDPDKAPEYTTKFFELTGYTAEDWKTANEAAMASRKTRIIMFSSISLAILLVAAFGIYNILNMTINEKMNDIAILKAAGFSGKDVINIFLKEAFIMGLIGTIVGLIFAATIIQIISGVYIGGDIGYFPIEFESNIFIMGSIVGMLITLGAAYIPALKAAKLDPITIFRR